MTDTVGLLDVTVNFVRPRIASLTIYLSPSRLVSLMKFILACRMISLHWGVHSEFLIRWRTSPLFFTFYLPSFKLLWQSAECKSQGCGLWWQKTLMIMYCSRHKADGQRGRSSSSLLNQRLFALIGPRLACQVSFIDIVYISWYIGHIYGLASFQGCS